MPGMMKMATRDMFRARPAKTLNAFACSRRSLSLRAHKAARPEQRDPNFGANSVRLSTMAVVPRAITADDVRRGNVRVQFAMQLALQCGGQAAPWWFDDELAVSPFDHDGTLIIE